MILCCCFAETLLPPLKCWFAGSQACTTVSDFTWSWDLLYTSQSLYQPSYIPTLTLKWVSFRISEKCPQYQAKRIVFKLCVYPWLSSNSEIRLPLAPECWVKAVFPERTRLSLPQIVYPKIKQLGCNRPLLSNAQTGAL